MPRPVVERARELLAQLEAGGSDFKLRSAQASTDGAHQLSFLDAPPNPALENLRQMRIDELSPLEALTKLYELKRMADDS
jgi:DNA mismatch repair protein MutS